MAHEKYNELSKACTKAHEDAFSRAPNIYKKACVTAQFWQFFSHHGYKADSKILRQATIENLQLNKNIFHKKSKKQTSLFRERWRGCLEIVKVYDSWSNKKKDIYAKLAGDEFEEFAVVNIPDEIFNRILHDLPDFLYYLLPPMEKRSPTDRRNTTRWYLWNAITLIPPGKIEKHFIEKQIRQRADEIKKIINDIFTYRSLDPNGMKYKKLFLKHYELAKDNRFFPYFKRIVLKTELKNFCSIKQSTIESYANSWKDDIKWIKERFSNRQRIYKQLKQEQETYAKHIYSWGFCDLVHGLSPVKGRCIPGDNVKSSSGDMNKHGFWYFTINKLE